MKQLNRQFNSMNSTVGWHVKHNTFKTTKLGPPVLSAIVTMQCFVFTQDVCNHVNSSLHISDTQVLARIHPVSNVARKRCDTFGSGLQVVAAQPTNRIVG